MPDIADRLKNIAISASVAMTQKARDLAAQGIDVVGFPPASRISQPHRTPLKPPMPLRWLAIRVIRQRTERPRYAPPFSASSGVITGWIMMSAR
jgi:hypothetical protein